MYEHIFLFSMSFYLKIYSVVYSIYSLLQSPNYSGGSQPGSLEALKNMIFKLQQEASITDSEDEGSRKKLSERVSTVVL